MSVLFLDSSVLAKRYLAETGSVWVSNLTEPSVGHVIVAAELGRVEVAAALAARCRAGTITLTERDALVALLLHHFAAEYRMIALDPATVSQAVTLTQRYRLRAYDAVQLATALTAAVVLPGLIFVAADHDLLEAAHAAGLTVDSPNAHA